MPRNMELNSLTYLVSWPIQLPRFSLPLKVLIYNISHDETSVSNYSLYGPRKTVDNHFANSRSIQPLHKWWITTPSFYTSTQLHTPFTNITQTTSNINWPKAATNHPWLLDKYIQNYPSKLIFKEKKNRAVALPQLLKIYPLTCTSRTYTLLQSRTKQ